MEKVIGTLNSDGSVKEWPEVDVRGAVYARPCTTVHLDNKSFVVIPNGFNDFERLEQLKRTLHAAPAPKAIFTKKENADEA